MPHISSNNTNIVSLLISKLSNSNFLTPITIIISIQFLTQLLILPVVRYTIPCLGNPSAIYKTSECSAVTAMDHILLLNLIGASFTIITIFLIGQAQELKIKPVLLFSLVVLILACTTSYYAHLNHIVKTVASVAQYAG